MVVRKVGKYEVGRTIGEGTFAKVKFAQNTETGESVAMKVLDRNTIIKHKMVDQVTPLTDQGNWTSQTKFASLLLFSEDDGKQIIFSRIRLQKRYN